MDFWHDAAAQKRWLRRFALLTGVLLLPVLVLAVFARPSADDFIYAARTHAVVEQYGLDLPRLLRAAWDTNVYYYENWQGLYVSGFTLAFQPPSSATNIMVPRWSVCCCRCFSACMGWHGAWCCVWTRRKGVCLGTGAAADFRLYRGHAAPVEDCTGSTVP